MSSTKRAVKHAATALSEFALRYSVDRFGTAHPADFEDENPARRTVFLYQDGLVVTPILFALSEIKILDVLIATGSFDWRTVSNLGLKQGYLRTAFRCLESLGWLDRSDDFYFLTAEGKSALAWRSAYIEVGRFLSEHAYDISQTFPSVSPECEKAFAAMVQRAVDHWNIPSTDPLAGLVLNHLQGALLTPFFLKALEDPSPQALWPMGSRDLGRLFHHLGFIDAVDSQELNAFGKSIAKYSFIFGMSGSYLPTFLKLPELIAGTSKPLLVESGQRETAVLRTVNVQSSAKAHKNYFKEADSLFLTIFNSVPVEKQPKFVADMGCGDGSWLVHIYDLIRTQTVRGRHLETCPLLMVGADFNEESLEASRQSFKRANIPFLAIRGDISEPLNFSQSLAERGIDSADGLHIRSFIDHNRRFKVPAYELTDDRPLDCGICVDSEGEEIAPELVQANLVDHLSQWARVADRHGLIIIEVHSVSPSATARWKGQLQSIAFDAYHALSHQYLVDYSTFLTAAERAGLRANASDQKRFPRSLPFTVVSLNHFTARHLPCPLIPVFRDLERAGEWKPTESLLEAAERDDLHGLLYRSGDLNSPNSWNARATEILAQELISLVERRIDEGKKTIRILDYGTGTGHFPIEFIKLAGQTGLFEKLAAKQINFSMDLADLPTTWFAEGYELLSDCPYVRFHRLTDESGSFVALSKLFGAESFDVIVASMVFHLIPEKALPKLIQGFSQILKPNGSLLFHSPDLGPPAKYQTVFHHPNRVLRATLLEMIQDPNYLASVIEAIPESLRKSCEGWTPLLGGLREASVETLQKNEEAANRQILPFPTEAQSIHSLLESANLSGSWVTRSFEMTLEQGLTAILLDSNQKYFPGIEDKQVRRAVTEALMKHYVLPKFQAMPWGTARGYMLQWTFGCYQKSPVETSSTKIRREVDELRKELLASGVGEKHLPDFSLPFGTSSGRIVILSHGIGQSPLAMREFVRFYQEQGDAVLTVLLDGHGKNRERKSQAMKRHSAESWEGNVDRALEIARHFDGNVVLAGFSLGAIVALNGALRRPGLVKGCLLLAPVIYPSTKTRRLVRAAKASWGIAYQQLRRNLISNLEQGIPFPVSVLVASDDQWVHVARLEAFCKGLPIDFCQVKGTEKIGHLGLLKIPRAISSKVAATYQSFVQRIGDSKGSG